MSEQPLNLDEIEARAAHLYAFPAHLLGAEALSLQGDQLTGVDVPAMAAEIRRLRAVMEQIRHLHKDSPMGPCPVCIDADAAAAGGDGLVPYPCPTGRLAGAQDCDPPHVRAAEEQSAPDPLAYGPTGYRCGCGKDAHSNLVPCQPDADGEQSAVAESEACGKCKQPFDPADTAFDGRARYHLTPYCRGCVDRCTDNEIADHRCVICAEGAQR
jgi:hypothetical protein